MTSSDLTRAMRRLRAIPARRERLTQEEADAIAAALRLGAHQTDVAAAVGRSREHVRRVAAARGIPSRYPPRGRTPDQDPT